MFDQMNAALMTLKILFQKRPTCKKKNNLTNPNLLMVIYIYINVHDYLIWWEQHKKAQKCSLH